jgi:hypothetical protein
MNASRWSARRAKKRLPKRVIPGVPKTVPNVAMKSLVTPRVVPLALLEQKFIELQSVVLGRLRDKNIQKVK